MPPAAPGVDDVRIRTVERADLLDVYRIEKACFAQPWPYAAFERFLDESGFLVAVRNEGPETEVLGYVVSDTTPNYGRDLGHVKDIAVREDARGRGLGRRLIERAIGGMAVDGAAVVKLEVRESNEAALSLYRGIGFDPLRRVPRYYADGEDALVMGLDVRAWQVRRGENAGSPEDADAASE